MDWVFGVVVIVVGFIILLAFLVAVFYLLNKIMPTTGPKAMSNDLQGVVRGFKESSYGGGQYGPTTVWTFELERHSETEERLDPIPVEMRGRSFSGFINEGNVVRLYEKTWNGGIVRTKRVYNVTFKSNVGVGRGCGAIAVLAILVISFASWLVYLAIQNL